MTDKIKTSVRELTDRSLLTLLRECQVELVRRRNKLEVVSDMLNGRKVPQKTEKQKLTLTASGESE